MGKRLSARLGVWVKGNLNFERGHADFHRSGKAVRYSTDGANTIPCRVEIFFFILQVFQTYFATGSASGASSFPLQVQVQSRLYTVT
jgi:hypothetical protein